METNDKKEGRKIKKRNDKRGRNKIRKITAVSHIRDF